MQYRRHFEADKSAVRTVDGKTRISLAFSSETPVLRTGDGKDHTKGEQYWEVLDHSSEQNFDLSLIRNRGAFLDEHDPKSHLGVVTSAEVNTGERMGRAEVEMDGAGLGYTRSRQMENGTRPHVSFGYVQTRLLSQSSHAGKPLKRFAWQANEISSVAVPADGAVGVGRSLSVTENSIHMNADKINAASESLTRTLTHQPELQKEISVRAARAIAAGHTVEQFNSEALGLLNQNTQTHTRTGVEFPEIGMNDSDVAGFSFTRLFRTLIHNSENPHNTESCPEFNLSKECSRKYSRKAAGYWIPGEVLTRSATSYVSDRARAAFKRDMQVPRAYFEP